VARFLSISNQGSLVMANDPNDRWKFIQTIYENPDDDVCRLVFCDWLEENNPDSVQAQYIRLALAYAEAKKEWAAKNKRKKGRRKHSTEVMTTGAEIEEFERCHFDDSLAGHDMAFYSLNGNVKFHLGLVSDLKIRCTDWAKFGTGLVEQHPIQRLDLSEKYPYQFRREEQLTRRSTRQHNYWSWWNYRAPHGISGTALVTEDILDILQGHLDRVTPLRSVSFLLHSHAEDDDMVAFKTRDEAMFALSDAYLIQARRHLECQKKKQSTILS